MSHCIHSKVRRIRSAQDDDDGDDESVEQLPIRDIGVNTDGDQETANTEKLEANWRERSKC